MAKVTLYLRFETSHGERSFARPVASNGKPLTDTGIPKPLYAFVSGRAEHHPRANTSCATRRMAADVGERWQRLLGCARQESRAGTVAPRPRARAIPAGPLFTSQTHIALVDAVEQYTARVKAMKARRTRKPIPVH